MSTTTTEKIHIIRAIVSNFQRLKAAAVEFDPEKGLHSITGKNGAGKTSLLNAIHAVFGGAGAVPEQPIRDDATEEERSYVQVALSNGFSLERRFTPAGTYLTVTGPDGGKHGQTKINEWIGPNSFDPMGFFGLKPKEAKEVLLGLSSDPDLPAKLAELDERRQELYEGRTPYIVAKRDAGKVTAPAGERPEPVDVSGDSARLEHLQKIQQRIGNLQQDAANNADAQARGREYIAELEAKLAQAKNRLDELEQEGLALVEEMGEIEDPSEEINAIKQRLAAANETSAALERWRRYDAAKEAYEEACERERELTALIADVDAEKYALLAEAGPGIQGLTFDAESGEPMLNGRPLASASGAERIRVAVEVALIANPALAVCLVDEATALDLDSLAALDTLAKERDFQILAVRIDATGDVLVEDGIASTNGKGGAS